jgi:hypothetical protein
VPFSLNLILYPLSVALDTADQDTSTYALNPIVAPAELSMPGVTEPDVGRGGPSLSTVTAGVGVIFCAAEKSVDTPTSDVNLALTHLELLLRVITFAGETLVRDTLE